MFDKESIDYYYHRLTTLVDLRILEILNEPDPPFEERPEFLGKNFHFLKEQFSNQEKIYKVTVLHDTQEPDAEVEIEIINQGSLHLEFKNNICIDAVYLSADDDTPEINDEESVLLLQIEAIYKVVNEFMKTGQHKHMNLKSIELKRFFEIKRILSRNWKFKQRYTDYISIDGKVD